MRKLWMCALVLLIALPLAAGELKMRREMLVTSGWLAEHLGEKPGALPALFGKKEVVVLCVGLDRKSYDEAHIPGAQFVALSELAVTQNGVPNELPDDVSLVTLARRLGLNRQKRIVLYDDMDGLLAARAWFTLDFLGLGDRAALLDGGWTKWKSEGRPVTSELPPAHKVTSYKPRMPRDGRVTLPEVREISHEILAGEKDSVLIDARPEAEFTGEKAVDGIPRAGHIPGAVSVYWRRALGNAENPVLRPAEQLRALFVQAGMAKKKTGVTYCRSGVQAAYDYFLLKYLGYDAKLYDGSFAQWSAARETVVEKSK